MLCVSFVANRVTQIEIGGLAEASADQAPLRGRSWKVSECAADCASVRACLAGVLTC